MFYKSIKAAYEAGKVSVSLPGERIFIHASGSTKWKVFFLTKRDRQRLANAVRAQCSKCRECGEALPAENKQGDGWHRKCAGCYPKDALPTSVDEATEISVKVDGEWFRVFPHISSDGLLAMRVLPMVVSCVLMPDGAIRMRPDTFVIPKGLPAEVVEEIERSFIETGRLADAAKAIFAAYAANDFEVIDS